MATDSLFVAESDVGGEDILSPFRLGAINDWVDCCFLPVATDD